MRSVLVLMTAVFLLGACSTKEVQVISVEGTQEPVRIEESGTVEVQMGKAELARFTDREEEIWKAARIAGLTKVFNKILTKDYVLLPSTGTAMSDPAAGTVSQHGRLAIDGDVETGDFLQQFLVTVKFAGDTRTSGQLVANKEGNYLSGMHDLAYAVLFGQAPMSLPAYVAIAKSSEELGPNFAKVIGVAEIKQVLDNKMTLTREQTSMSGTLCVLEIMVSSGEIEKGDQLYLLKTDVAALDAAKSIVEPELETVVVQPPYSDKVKEPKAKK